MTSVDQGKANEHFAAALIGQLVQSGVGHIAVSPGGRSAPLALAVAALEAHGAHSERRSHPAEDTAGGSEEDGHGQPSHSSMRESPERDDPPDRPNVSVSVHVDERSAAFYALGWSRGSGRPAALVCTSGSAPAHYLPAVMEAHYARVPLVLMTADRPPELRDTGAWQAADQSRLYGTYVRWDFEAPVPSGRPGEEQLARSLAARAVAEAQGEMPGPVHLNLPFREPLVSAMSGVQRVPGPERGGLWDTRFTPAGRGTPNSLRGFLTESSTRSPAPDTLDALAERLARTRRGLIVAGRDPIHPWPGADGASDLAESILRLAEVLGWPVLAEATGGVRRLAHEQGAGRRPQGTHNAHVSHGGALVLSGYDAYLRWTELDVPRPELILRFGGSPVWKHVSAYLDAGEADRVLIDPGATWDDPGRRGGLRLFADPVETAQGLAERLDAQAPDPDPDWVDWWRRADQVVGETLEDALENEGRDHAAGTTLGLPAAIQAALTRPAVIALANSMAVRDFESFSRPTGLPHHVYANRGVAGIDGTVSTAAGVASGARRPGVLLTGDLALVHDANGLAVEAAEGLAVVVANDSGGGIFRYLPMADSPAFARFFRTPSVVDIGSLARAYGRSHVRAETTREVTSAVADILERRAFGLVEVPVDMDANTGAHKAFWSRVRRRLDPGER